MYFSESICFAVLSLLSFAIFPVAPLSIVAVPGCCINAVECEQWTNSFIAHSRNTNLWFELYPSQNNPICSTSPSSLVVIDVDHFTSASFQNNAVTISGSNENDEPSEISFSFNASLQLSKSTKSSLHFPKNSYCIRKRDDSFIEVEMCLSKHLWYRKCCPVGQGFNFSYGCVDLEHESHTKFPPVESQEEANRFYPVVTYPTCKYPTIISTAVTKLGDYVPTPWKIVGSNRISYFDRNSKISTWKAVTEHYCVDELILHQDSIDNETCGVGEQDIFILCEERHSENANYAEASYYIYTNIISLGIAMCFLVATAVGLVVLEKQNIHKKSMLFYVLSQTLFYGLIFLIYLNHIWKVLSEFWCVPVGVLAHFFGLSTFTWLLVINFDLFWTFRVLSPTIGLHWTRFVWYAIIASAIPTLVISVALLIHNFVEEPKAMCRNDKEERHLIGPGYGHENCFLSDDAQLPYFYVPVGILLLTNVIFYSCTSYRLCTLNKKNQKHSAKKHRNSCQLLLKLFIVMGTIWILQVLHALIDLHERTWYWSIVDVGSVLQSIAIFIIFICKRENWRTLTKKYPSLRGMFCTHGLETIPDNTPDGSTRLSRTEGPQRKSGGQTDYQQPSEIIQLPYHNTA